MDWVWNLLQDHHSVLASVAIAVIVLAAGKLYLKYIDSSQAHAVQIVKDRQEMEKARRKVAEDAIKKLYFTAEELASYKGTNGKPIYIGLLDEIYDVSAKSDLYGPDGAYHCFAGRDASRALAKMSFEEEDINAMDLSDLTPSEQSTLDEWVTKFSVVSRYPVVGRLLHKQDLTREQLKKYNGIDNTRGSIYVACCNTIYDVTMNGKSYYGPQGAYKSFAGMDASRALACMSLDAKCLEIPNLRDLTESQQKTLQDWVAKFQQKYPIVGVLLDDK